MDFTDATTESISVFIFVLIFLASSPVFSATVILYGLFVYFNVAKIWRLVIFIPAMMTAVGFLQARMHFCANFGLRGVFNFGPEVGKVEYLELPEFKAMDRRKALQIIAYSAAVGAVVAVLAYYLP